MKRIVVVAAALSLAVGAGATSAAAGGWGHGGMHGAADLNGDGAVTRAEAQALREVTFLRWDYDGDGILTQQEMIDREVARITRRIAKRFAKIDTNGDGRVERAEFEARMDEQFTQLDTDGDGQLGEMEMPRRGHGWRHGHHRDGAGGMYMHRPDGTPFVPGAD